MWLQWILSKQYPTPLADDRVAKMCPHSRDPTAWVTQCHSVSLSLFGLMHLFTRALPVTFSCDFNIMGCLSNLGVTTVHSLSTDLLTKPGTKSISSNHFLKTQFFHYSFRRIMTNIFVSIPLADLLWGINSILYHCIPNTLTMPDIVCTQQISAALLTK